MTFRVGQKVVCVDASGLTVSSGLIAEGCVYTIERVDGPDPEDGDLGLHLVGVIRACSRYTNWKASRFRPVVERKTDISFAHEILRKATKPAPAVSMSLQP